MIKRNRELKKKVISVLADNEKARNSDIALMIGIWEKYHFTRLKKREADGKVYVALSDLYDLPREDHIKRIRAKIQNEEKRFLPTSEKVAKQRKLNMGEWYKWAKLNNINY